MQLNFLNAEENMKGFIFLMRRRNGKTKIHTDEPQLY